MIDEKLKTKWNKTKKKRNQLFDAKDSRRLVDSNDFLKLKLFGTREPIGEWHTGKRVYASVREPPLVYKKIVFRWRSAMP